MQTAEENRLDSLALSKQDGRGKLHWRIHREKCIGDDFQASSRFHDEIFRTACYYPRQFHLWQSRNLGDSAEREGECAGISDKAAARLTVVRVVEKDLINDQRKFVSRTESIQRVPFRCGCKR